MQLQQRHQVIVAHNDNPGLRVAQCARLAALS